MEQRPFPFPWLVSSFVPAGFSQLTPLILKATSVKPRRRKVLQIVCSHTTFSQTILADISRQYINWIYKFESSDARKLERIPRRGFAVPTL